MLMSVCTAQLHLCQDSLGMGRGGAGEGHGSIMAQPVCVFVSVDCGASEATVSWK